MTDNVTEGWRAVFFLSTYARPGTPGTPGGVISTYHLCRAVAAVLPTTIIAFDSKQAEPLLRRTEMLGEAEVPIITARSPKFGPGMSALRSPGHLRQVVRDSDVGPLDRTMFFSGSVTLGVAGWVRRQGGIPVSIVRAFEDFGARAPGGTLSARMRGFRQALARGFQAAGAMRAVAMAVVNSDFMGAQVKARFGSDIQTRTVYPPLDLTIGSSASPDPMTVGFVDRSADKNGDFVMRLAAYMPDRKFLIYGRSIEEPLPANVENRGWETDRDRLFSSAAVWIVPSRWNEPFGRVAIEALAKGAAVCVSRRGGLPEAVGDHGTIIDGFDLGDWAAAIRSARPPADPAAALARFIVPAHDRHVARLIHDLISPMKQDSNRRV